MPNSSNFTQYSKFFSLSLLTCIFLLTSCRGSNQPASYEADPVLTSISIVDRNGLSETINNPDRLQQFTLVDFEQSQPYQKVLRIYNRDIQGNIPACITSYHPNGSPKQYLEVMNSRAFGEYKEWFPSGALKIEANVIEGKADIVDGAELTWVFDGTSQVFNEAGELEATIPYAKGELEGTSLYYHPNGNVWKSVPYHKNVIEGTLEIFLSDLTLLQRTNYKNGLKQGESVRYWNCTQIAAEETYCEGLLEFGNYYNSLGEPISTITNGNGTRAVFGKESILELQDYRFGSLEGEIKVFDRCNRVNKIYHVKNGCKHGEEIFFYDAVRLQPKLKPKLSINWYDGKIQGISKSWYDNEIQESQKEMSNNKKNGHSTNWYRDGSLMMIEEYEQDKILRGEYYQKGERTPITTVNEGDGIATLYDGDGNFIRKIIYYHGKPQIEE